MRIILKCVADDNVILEYVLINNGRMLELINFDCG